MQSNPAKTLLLISCIGSFSNGVIISQNLGIFLYRSLCLYIIYSVVMDSWYGYSSGVIMQAYETQPSMQLTSITHSSYVWMYAVIPGLLKSFCSMAHLQGPCTSPQKNKRIVRTASQQQVRQKVYQGSSEAWRKYEPYLDGAFNSLPSS